MTLSTNTTYLGAQAPGLPAYYRGYHDEAAMELKPGANAFWVHASGIIGRDAREDPQAFGDLSRIVGGASSTHVLVWAGKPKSLDHRDVENILANFRSAPFTYVDVLSGDGSNSYGGLADSVGAATRGNLEAKLDDIGLLMNLGPDEQFIFFVTDHGNNPFVTATSTPLPTDTFEQPVVLDISAGALAHALAEVGNQMSVTLMTTQDIRSEDEIGIGAGMNDLCFFGYLNAAQKETLEGPDGGGLFAYTYEVDKSCLTDVKSTTVGGSVTQTVVLYNFSTTDVTFETIVLDLGALGRLEASPDELAVLAVARAQGAGAFFQSRWDLFNAGDTGITLEMTYTPRADIGGNAVTVDYTLPAGTMLELDDPFTDVFGMPGGTAVGSALVHVAEGAVGDFRMQTVVSANLDDGSVFGQFFPAVPVAEGIIAGETVWLNTTENPARNRVNVGVMALEAGTSLTVTPVDPIDTPLAAAQEISLDEGESTQVNDLDRIFGLGGRADYLVEVSVTSGTALAYASVLDGNDGTGTSDPTTILPVAGGASQVTLLELGSIQGLNEFSGSASVTNHSAIDANIRADFYQRDVPGVSANRDLTLGPGETIGYGDVIDDLFGIQGVVGTLVLTVTNGAEISATAREFAVFRDNSGDMTGTAGQLMQGLSDYDLLDPGRTWHFIGLRQMFDSSGIERSHIALFNPEDEPVTATISLFDGSSGDFEGTTERIVEPGCLIQINNIINVINSGQDGGVKRIELLVSGPVHARAFRVNTSGDPITIDAL